jgi:exopolyphosphatase/guanosine-5'-triphosphate,3'-diphosphate pyrophosphatase
VKCLHAHVAHTLAGGDDPVGRWTLEQLGANPDDPGATQPNGTLTLAIDDRDVVIRAAGSEPISLPIGPLALLDGPLRDEDPPAPASLTNALGLVHDHLDDAIIAEPAIGETTDIVIVGRHAVVVAAVEVGADDVEPGHRLSRAEADEVFRTLALESVDDRRHNPGLPEEYVESIVATCCVILGVMRRLQLDGVTIGGPEAAV